jgi:hypothetical protein
MTREVFIERALRQIYGAMPTDDSQITINLVNKWLEDAVAVAAQKNYVDSIKLDGIAYVNDSFYTTYKELPVTQDAQFLWKISLPQIPVGIGNNEGISQIQFKNSDGEISLPCVPLNTNQRTIFRTMRPILGRVLTYYEGDNAYVISTILLNGYTANISMISGGDSTNLNSTLNCPPDYFPIMVEYIKGQLAFERAQIQDTSNDGTDNK